MKVLCKTFTICTFEAILKFAAFVAKMVPYRVKSAAALPSCSSKDMASRIEVGELKGELHFRLVRC